MKKYLAGCFYDDCNIPEGHYPEKYYTNDYESFYDENDKLLDNNTLKEWAIWNNSPWSLTCEKYEIKYNCKDYSDILEGEPKWTCSYHVVGYDGIATTVIQYGNTPEEALEKTKAFFQYLQKNYNLAGESI